MAPFQVRGTVVSVFSDVLPGHWAPRAEGASEHGHKVNRIQERTGKVHQGCRRDQVGGRNEGQDQQQGCPGVEIDVNGFENLLQDDRQQDR